MRLLQIQFVTTSFSFYIQAKFFNKSTQQKIVNIESKLVVATISPAKSPSAFISFAIVYEETAVGHALIESKATISIPSKPNNLAKPIVIKGFPINLNTNLSR